MRFGFRVDIEDPDPGRAGWILLIVLIGGAGLVAGWALAVHLHAR